MSAVKLLQDANTLQDVAHLLGFKPKALAYLIRVMHLSLRYSQFEIPKRSGGKRIISAPNARLKLLQKRLAKHLQLCEAEIESARGVKQRLAHGFKKDQSILTNADVHRKRRYVLNIDIEDFFGSINFGRIRGFFIRNKDFCLKPDVATVIAQIACHNNALPQGSPCSPVLSNLIANILDINLAKLSKINGCSYTRYVDDITFSTSKKDFPRDLAVTTPGSPNLWIPGKVLEKIIGDCGFTINAKKTRLQYCYSRQDVTGIVVNQRVNTRSEYRRMLRAMVHRLCATGSYALQKCEITVTGSTTMSTKLGSLAELEGMLNFARHVEIWSQRNDFPKRVALTSSELLLRRFLFFKEFSGQKKPVLLFEGKTDAIYLRESIRRLASTFPSLATPGTTPLKLHIKLYRQSDTSGKLFGLKGGTGHFLEFIKNYGDNYKQISAPKGEFPVIILLDNDSGIKSVLSLIKDKYKIVPAAGQQYFNVTGNLYIMLTSPFGGPDHCIEDMFDAATLATSIGGKSFSKSNNFNQNIQYGKAWFAEKVIKKNSASINFNGFCPLLIELVNLISKHALGHSSAKQALLVSSYSPPPLAPLPAVP